MGNAHHRSNPSTGKLEPDWDELIRRIPDRRKQLESLHRSWERRPGNLRTLRSLSRLLMREYQSAAAPPILRHIAERAPRDAVTQVNLGICLKSGGDKTGAEAAYRRALEIDPDDFFAHFNLGVLLEVSGKRAEAAHHFEAAIRSDPDDPDSCC